MKKNSSLLLNGQLRLSYFSKEKEGRYYKKHWYSTRNHRIRNIIYDWNFIHSFRVDGNYQQCHNKLKYIQSRNNFSLKFYIFIHESNITGGEGLSLRHLLGQTTSGLFLFKYAAQQLKVLFGIIIFLLCAMRYKSKKLRSP